MPKERIRFIADTIDGAAEQILHILVGADNQREVMYFGGWYGWGASAVLKAVVKQLRSSYGLADAGTARDLGKIIHVDVSQWQSKRALQKVIAEELELPPQVMALFHQYEEEDDFDGAEQSDRAVIPYVKAAIMNELMAGRFLVVLHNGSGSYIDLWEAGVPVIGQLSRRVLCTSRGRFWHRAKDGHEMSWRLDDVESTKWCDAAISAVTSLIYDDEEVEPAFLQILRDVLYAEAEEVANHTGIPEPGMNPNIVIRCILYMMALQHNVNISWESHASNYWVCDGIIQDGTDCGRSAWEIGDALQRNMIMDFCSKCAEEICYVMSGEQQRFIDHWVSVTNQKSTQIQVPSQATSFFWTAAAPSTIDQDRSRVLEASMFEHSDSISRLRDLSYCNFSFSYPPFSSCNNLRFLIVDHCKDQDAQDRGDEDKEYHHRSNYIQQGNGAWFRSLWVLELSYTDWYWLLSKQVLDLMVDLREFNVKGVGNRSMMHLHRCSGTGSNRSRLIKLQVVADDTAALDNGDDGSSGRRNQQVSPPVVASSFFPDLSSWHILKTVILDGCSDLELIDCNALPLSLESFTLMNSVTASSKIKRISFQGRTGLKTLLLRGLFDSLVELDMSGTRIRTLDLSATQAWGLRRLFLLGCEELCVILWPKEEFNKMVRLEILRIDTTYAASDREEGTSNKQQEASIGSSPSAAMVWGKDRTIIDSDSYISPRDPRLFRSLLSLRHRYWLHVEISSIEPGHKRTTGRQGITATGGGCGSLYADDIIISTTNGSNLQADDANRDAFEASLVMKSKCLWDCPPIPMHSDWAHCYISIQDETQTKALQGGATTSTRQLTNRATTLPALVSHDARTLHLHDSLSTTSLPGPAEPYVVWNGLRWCRLERCPNLEGVVFNAPQGPQRGRVASIFQTLQTFWASQLPKARYIWKWITTSEFRPGYRSFEHIVFLHRDYCPRLVHVLPMYTSMTNGCRSLETLEIVCCGNLGEVFPLDSKSQQQERPREFPRLKRIHLYELPKLQRICGRRMLAPNLKTVKVRGCWSLKRLPGVRADANSSKEESSEDITPLSTVDLNCEKEWWDSLEWDGEEAGHHSSHYKPTYSGYNRKNLLRASVLR